MLAADTRAAGFKCLYFGVTPDWMSVRLHGVKLACRCVSLEARGQAAALTPPPSTATVSHRLGVTDTSVLLSSRTGLQSSNL